MPVSKKFYLSDLTMAHYYILKLAVAPWFTPTKYPGGGYLKIHEEVGDLIDWYNIQFYNQEASRYDTSVAHSCSHTGSDIYTKWSCETLLHAADGWFPGTAIFEIAAKYVP